MNQTASQRAKQLGAKSLKQVSTATGVSFQTLNNWYNNKPALFDVAVIGAVEMARKNEAKK